jgi:glycosyltransferase involved in cell wall biosynthesis
MAKDDTSLRVALITSYPPKKCGIAQFSLELVGALRHAGHDVLVIGDEASASADISVDLGSHGGLQRAAESIERHRAHVIHLQWEPGLFSRRARLLLPRWINHLGRPTVVSIHSISTVLERSPRGLFSYFWSRKAESRLVTNQSTTVTVTTQTMARLVEARYGKVSAHVVPLGMEPKRAPAETIPSDFAVLCFGFIAPGKQLETVVELARLRPDRRFIIAGSPAGPRAETYLRHLRTLAAGLRNLEIVARWIPEDELDTMVSGALATILPTAGEYRASAAYTRSIALGVPVIALKGSSVGEPVEKSGSGVLSESQAGKGFALALGTLETEYGRVKMGVQAAQREYAWSAIVRDLDTLYRGATSGSGS